MEPYPPQPFCGTKRVLDPSLCPREEYAVAIREVWPVVCTSLPTLCSAMSQWLGGGGLRECIYTRAMGRRYNSGFSPSTRAGCEVLARKPPFQPYLSSFLNRHVPERLEF